VNGTNAVLDTLSALRPSSLGLSLAWDLGRGAWANCKNLSVIVPDFADWPIPSPQALAPFVAGVELFGGMFLLVGFLIQIFAGAGSVSADRWLKHFAWQHGNEARCRSQHCRLRLSGLPNWAPSCRQYE
jgi:hypothetical protein